MLRRDQIIEGDIDIRPPLAENEVLQIDGALGVSLNNAGDSTVTVNGLWTIAPNATLQIAAPVPWVAINTQLRIMFSGGTTNRLEVMELRLKGEAYSNFTKDGTAN